MQENQLNSPFLCLPAELCNRLYELAFTGQSITVLRKRNETSARKEVGAIVILLTCRQIQHDVALLFYSFTTFNLDLFNQETDSPGKSLAALGAENCSPIQSIKIHGIISVHTYPYNAYMNYGGKTCPDFMAEGTASLTSMQRVEILCTDYLWRDITKTAFVISMRI
jgi:hypothetical protein